MPVFPGSRSARRGPDPRGRLRRPGQDDSGATAYVFTLGVLLFFLLASLSAYQVTSPGPARRILEAGIVALTDVDTVIAEHQKDLAELAAADPGQTGGYAIPGYPLDVNLSRTEVALPPAELRRVVLERSSALVYAHGVGAFDRTGKQSLSMFSTQGALEVLVGQLSEDSHARIAVVTLALALLAGLVGLAVVFKANGYGRIGSLGNAALPAGLLGLALAAGLRWVAGRFGGDDAFGRDLREVVDAVAAVPLWNYGALAVAGVALIAAGLGLRLADGLLVRDMAAEPAAPAFPPLEE